MILFLQKEQTNQILQRIKTHQKQPALHLMFSYTATIVLFKSYKIQTCLSAFFMKDVTSYTKGAQNI